MVDVDGHGVRTRSLQERARHSSDTTYILKTMFDADGHGVRTCSLQGRARYRSGKTYRLKTQLTPTDMV